MINDPLAAIDGQATGAATAIPMTAITIEAVARMRASGSRRRTIRAVSAYTTAMKASATPVQALLAAKLSHRSAAARAANGTMDAMTSGGRARAVRRILF